MTKYYFEKLWNCPLMMQLCASPRTQKRGIWRANRDRYAGNTEEET